MMIRIVTSLLFALWVSAGYANAQSRIAPLAMSKIEISKLDWVFLNAKIESLNTHSAMDLRRFSFDRLSDRIVATVRVSRNWVESTSLEKAKADLQSAAIAYCVNVFVPIEEQTGT